LVYWEKENFKAKMSENTNNSSNNATQQKGKKAKIPEPFFDKISWIPSNLLTRTPHCKHNFSCFENIVRGWWKSFLYGYGIKSAISLLGLMISRKIFKDPSKILSLFNIDSIRFGAFLGSFSAVYKFVLCILRRIRNTDDGTNSLIAGALAGLSLAFESSSRRETWALYSFVRSLECLFNYLVEQGYIKKIKYGEVLLFAFCASFLMTCHAYEPEVLDKGYSKFLTRFASLKPNDGLFLELWREGYRRRWEAARAAKLATSG